MQGNYVLYRGVVDGEHVSYREEYRPTLFLPSTKPTEFTTIKGEYVEPVQPGTIKDCREFVRNYEQVDNFNFYGNTKYIYPFIADKHDGHIDYDINDINIIYLDIETECEGGFPDVENANEVVNLITMKFKDKYYTFGCGDYELKDIIDPDGKITISKDEIDYCHCQDEIQLLECFIDKWREFNPDVVTGWNVQLFDTTYLVNRIARLLGEKEAKKLSPWGMLRRRTISSRGKDFPAVDIIGVATMDYLDLYRRYTYITRENYKLDTIAEIELGDKKLDYSEIGAFHLLYKQDWQMFTEYNIKDVHLVERLENKLKLIELAIQIAYVAKVNYEDVGSQVRTWDALIYNHLRENNQVIPQNVNHSKDGGYVGAYVKDPIVGFHKWVASFDLNSLYPHLIMQYNQSPDTVIDVETLPVEVRRKSAECSVDNLLEQKLDLSVFKNHNVNMTPNGAFFRTDKRGFMVDMMQLLYDQRKIYKKEMLKQEQLKEDCTDKAQEKTINFQISKFKNLQMAYKILLNSCYGATGNQFFRFYDLRIATGITTAGQLSIRWIEKAINNYFNTLLKTDDVDYVIASDTDSVYICMDALVSKVYADKEVETAKVIEFMDKVCTEKLEPFIEKNYNALADYMNAYQQKMVMAREVLCDKAIWTAKKRYILNVHNSEGVQYTKPKQKVMGLELKKSSTPSACRALLTKAVDLIINTDEQTVIDFIEKSREEFPTHKVEEISFPRGVNNLAKYSCPSDIIKKGCPIHARGTLMYNHFLKQLGLQKKYEKIKSGEKIKFLYLKLPNPAKQNVIAFTNTLPEEFGLHEYIDYDMQFEKSFLEPLKLILNAIDWKSEKTASLEDFFC